MFCVVDEGPGTVCRKQKKISQRYFYIVRVVGEKRDGLDKRTRITLLLFIIAEYCIIIIIVYYSIVWV